MCVCVCVCAVYIQAASKLVLMLGIVCKYYNCIEHAHAVGEAEKQMTVSDKQASGQLTIADGECILLYTVNNTHCTHYCDSDTCL